MLTTGELASRSPLGSRITVGVIVQMQSLFHMLHWGKLTVVDSRLNVQAADCQLTCALSSGDYFLSEMGGHLFVVVEFHDEAAAPLCQ